MPRDQFQLVSNYQPSGDQPQAIKELVEGVQRGDKAQVLLGVTGSGKTFTISNVIQQVQKPTLVISPNKTLAAQLYGELKSFFPNNAVEFFISYYDYYQPEAYIAKTDVYIEKDFSINDEIDRLRIRATSALVDGRRDVIVVASVSCIYGIGTREDFAAMLTPLKIGTTFGRKEFLYKLAELYYERNDFELGRGTYRVRGDVIEVMPAFEEEKTIRIEFWGDEIEKISIVKQPEGKVIEHREQIILYPAKIFVTSRPQLEKAIVKIKEELVERLEELREQGKLVEAQRLEQRTLFDIEMMKEVGYCSGVENYSMHLSGRTFGDTPSCLMNYFPDDYLLILDESHITVPQVRGMYNGDRVRKTTLVEHGFRLPSAKENRPLQFEEFTKLTNQVIYVSATPADYELEQSNGVVVEQIIRPTGLLDPEISLRPVHNQIDDLLAEIRKRTLKKERVIVTTLTKRMAEDLTDYLKNLQISVAYIHSDIDALERVEIIRDLRLGKYDVLIGVNLLREGLDMPEVSLVAILDADKEGFLRSERSLLQTAGRTARNVDGLVILYAAKMTKSMQKLIDVTNRRRKIQMEYNEKHNINPVTIYKSIEDILSSTSVADIQASRQGKISDYENAKIRSTAEPLIKYLTEEQKKETLDQLYEEMKKAARDLDFERAAELRDEISFISDTPLTTATSKPKPKASRKRY